LVLDATAKISEDLAPAVRVVGSSHRVEILYVLSGGPSTVSRMAEETGLSRRTVNRHLAVLREYGLVKLQPRSRNGRIYSLDRDQAAMLTTTFISVMARAGSFDAAAPVESADAPEEGVPPVAARIPEACIHCQNAYFVREVMDELDQLLVRAREYEVRLRQMSSQVLTAQEEERKRIARELHDDTAQALTSVLVRLRLMERSLGDERLQKGLTELRALTGATLEGVRRLAIDLRPPMLDDLGLEAALQSLVQDFSQRWPIKATFASSRLGRLPVEAELVLYRIVQEALSNVAKHANASTVLVRLTRRGQTLRLLVEDDGCGFDVEATKHSRESGLGLFGMEERLALVGGTLWVNSAVGGGTRVSAEVRMPRRGRR
jgi:signal transduction histidine kinase